MAKVRSPECLHLIIKYPLHTCSERLGSGIPQPHAVGQHNGLEVTGERSSLRLGKGTQPLGDGDSDYLGAQHPGPLCRKRAKGMTHVGHAGLD